MSSSDELLHRFPHLAKLPRGCYVVGGAIRDLLLGIEPADVDVACLDPEAAALRVGPRPIRLGTEDHLSAWRVAAGGHVYDFAALLDGAIGPDLARRDFTINAMAVSLDDGRFLDPHRGEADLRRRMVRMIDPSNFDDDPLRCLKAVRMAVSFGFDVEERTLEAIRRRAGTIAGVAAERVTYELAIIFSAGRFRRAVDLLDRSGLDHPLFGRNIEEPFHADDVSLAGAMALLVREPRLYAKRWRWSVDLLREVTALQELIEGGKERRMALYDAGERVARQLPAVLRAIGREERLPEVDFSIRALLTGEQIAEATGLPAGPALGRIKRALLEAQVRGDVTTKADALAFVSTSSTPR